MSTLLPDIPGVKPAEPYNVLIQQYLLMMYQKGMAVTTIKTYGWHLNRFATWLVEHGVYHPERISPIVILEWGGHLRSIYVPQTQKVCVGAIKSFFKFLLKLNACTESNYEHIQKFLESPKVVITPQRTLTAHEVYKLSLACQGPEPIEIRARTLISLLLDTGLRAAELCGIKQKNLDINRRKISIIGKGGQEEFVFFGFECQQTLIEWMSVRKRILAKHDYLFVSLGGNTPEEKITPRGLRIILKRLGEQANVENVHPHAFRRSFATIRIKTGQSTRAVQRLGRWKNLSTFERYTQALLIDDDFARYEAAHYSPLKDVAKARET